MNEQRSHTESGLVCTTCMQVTQPGGRCGCPSRSRTEVSTFLAELAAQKPEKPDHWSSCSQCERNAERAQELLDALPDEDVSHG